MTRSGLERDALVREARSRGGGPPAERWTMGANRVNFQCRMLESFCFQRLSHWGGIVVKMLQYTLTIFVISVSSVLQSGIGYCIQLTPGQIYKDNNKLYRAIAGSAVVLQSRDYPEFNVNATRITKCLVVGSAHYFADQNKNFLKFPNGLNVRTLDWPNSDGRIAGVARPLITAYRPKRPKANDDVSYLIMTELWGENQKNEQVSITAPGKLSGSYIGVTHGFMVDDLSSMSLMTMVNRTFKIFDSSVYVSSDVERHDLVDTNGLCGSSVMVIHDGSYQLVGLHARDGGFVTFAYMATRYYENLRDLLEEYNVIRTSSVDLDTLEIKALLEKKRISFNKVSFLIRQFIVAAGFLNGIIPLTQVW